MNDIRIAQWDTYTVSFTGPNTDGARNTTEFSAVFSLKNRTQWVRGFYDGEGVYKLRFMPDAQGEWKFETKSNEKSLDGLTGGFVCTPPASHGPVIAGTRGMLPRLMYADGTSYSCVGTTCYCWNHQGDALEERTLETLKNGPFNKIRMCVFPKHYVYNTNDPEFFPFVGGKNGDKYEWKFDEFDPRAWRHLEKRIEQLRDMGIEADLILFHPYDRWGFADMPREVNLEYLRYAVARLAGYRNVWWSFANEYDLMRNKTMADWDEYFRLVAEEDPYNRLRSIHNCNGFYDYAKRWVTHCSIQSQYIEKVPQWVMDYRKPVVIDECCYEGDIPDPWGNISGAELVNRMWTGFALGGYVGHGETFLSDDDILWWSRGGVLHGQSPERIAFLRKIVESLPEPTGYFRVYPWQTDGLDYGGEKILCYYGVRQPSKKIYALPEGAKFKAQVFDAWNMTIEDAGEYSGKAEIKLPGKPYCGLLLSKIN